MADVISSKIDSVAVDATNFDLDLITRDGDVLTTFVKLNAATSKVDIKKDANITGAIIASGSATVSIAVLGTAATTFLTHTAGLVQSRTAAQVLSDIGSVVPNDFVSYNDELVIFNDNVITL